MKRLMVSAVLLCIALTMIGCGPAKGDNSKDLAAVRGVIEKYESTANAGDLEGWMSVWDENGIRMAADEPAIVGKQAIRAAMAPLFEGFNDDVKINYQEVQASGNLGFVRGTYVLKATPKAGGAPFVYDGKFLSVCLRQGDGSWKLLRDCFNSNAAPK